MCSHITNTICSHFNLQVTFAAFNIDCNLQLAGCLYHIAYLKVKKGYSDVIMKIKYISFTLLSTEVTKVNSKPHYLVKLAYV